MPPHKDFPLQEEREQQVALGLADLSGRELAQLRAAARSDSENGGQLIKRPLFARAYTLHLAYQSGKLRPDVLKILQTDDLPPIRILSEHANKKAT